MLGFGLTATWQQAQSRVQLQDTMKQPAIKAEASYRTALILAHLRLPPQAKLKASYRLHTRSPGSGPTQPASTLQISAAGCCKQKQAHQRRMPVQPAQRPLPLAWPPLWPRWLSPSAPAQGRQLRARCKTLMKHHHDVLSQALT